MRWTWIAAVILATLANGQTPGQVTERVTCQARPEQSYALYLPSTYTPDRPWPVMFVFDPAARALLALKLFQPGAEEHGYIVLVSWNSRNGSFESSRQAMEAMWDDARTRFAFDGRRAYAAGFSGGARSAMWFALGSASFAGVIASGGGFPGGPFEPPDKIGVDVFGSAGEEDFNLSEMQMMERHLGKLKTPHKFVFHEGPHAWAPPAVISEAMAWFQARAMATGRAERTAALLEYKRLQEDRIAAAPPAAQLRLARSLAFVFPDEWAAKAAEIAKSKPVRKALEQEQSLEQKQLAAESEFGRLEREDRGSLAAELRRWAKRAGEADPSDDRRLARRVLQGQFARLFEARYSLLQKKQYSEVIWRMELAAEIPPARPGVWFELARVYLEAGKQKEAIATLERAVSAGFKDRPAIEGAFAPLANHPKFRELIARL
jgi:predicted esterase